MHIVDVSAAGQTSAQAHGPVGTRVGQPDCGVQGAPTEANSSNRTAKPTKRPANNASWCTELTLSNHLDVIRDAAHAVLVVVVGVVCCGTCSLKLQAKGQTATHREVVQAWQVKQPAVSQIEIQQTGQPAEQAVWEPLLFAEAPQPYKTYLLKLFLPLEEIFRQCCQFPARLQRLCSSARPPQPQQ